MSSTVGGSAEAGVAPGLGTAVADAAAAAHQREWAFVLAATARVAGDLDIAEECTQDAFVAALQQWPTIGVPQRPGAWLTTVARRRAYDQLRREASLSSKLRLLVDDADDAEPGPEEGAVPEPTFADDRLRLIFTCAHPALSVETRVALTLRLVAGLTTPQVARAMLLSEPTAAARLTRAKKKIAAARIPYRTPSADELPQRLDAVLTVVHLVFTAGHTSAAGPSLLSTELLDRSLHLARVLHALLPDEAEATGLLALLLLTDARRDTRVDTEGRLVLLADQDRSRWDVARADEGRDLVARALRQPRPGGVPGRFTLQAAIAAVHAQAPTYAATDWREIIRLYDELLREWPNPVVALNRAVAVAMADGPGAGLDTVEALSDDPRLRSHPYLPSTRADLLRRLGRTDEAASAYREAIALTANEAEQRFLQERLAALGGTDRD